VSAVPAPATDQAALRDRIAEVVRTVELRLGPGAVDVARRGLPISVNLSEADAMADAVLAVLPASLDRADALSQAERTMLTYALDQAQERIWSEGGFTEEDQAAVTSLRRMADETPQPETQPRRGDAFEAWLKAQRDEYEVRSSPQWIALDEVLDTYRLHADTGTPLGEHVCEGRVVGDRECLEAPAVVAQPDGEA
jgi:hypothetical protein